MAYTSVEFYAFIFIMLIFYYIMPLKYRWEILLAGSVVFYFAAYKTGWWIILATVVFSYIAGIILQVQNEKYQNRVQNYNQKHLQKLRKIVFITAVIIIIVPWFVIKNGNFIIASILKGNAVSWVVPMGISFYTLQIVSYLADIYTGKIKAQKNFARFVLFILFFPQIVQGPLPRFQQLGEQLYTGHLFSEQAFVKGCQMVLWGFFLKFMIADKAAVVVNEIFGSPGTYMGCYVLVGGILYSFELYTDFMACVKISQGTAAMFGIKLVNNFMHPYFSLSVKEFWRRWHISFSTWLKDYIYIPLGGSRKGKYRKYLNLTVTFVASGIWHGAGYKFIFWGLIHAGYQIAGEILHPLQKKIYNILKLPAGIKKAVQQLIVFFLVMPAWVIFRANGLKTGLSMLKSMFTVHNFWIFFNDSLFTLGLNWKEWLVLILSILLLAAVGKKQENGICIRRAVLEKPVYIRWAVYIFAILGIMVLGTYGFGFNAQDFIYGGF